MTYQVIAEQRRYSGNLEKRFRLLPVALAVLMTIAVIGSLMRLFVMRLEPKFDLTPYYKQCEQADALAGTVMMKSSIKIATHDLEAIKKRLAPEPVPEIAPVSQNTPQVAKIQSVVPIAPPPRPRLMGIIFSESGPSLAVFASNTLKVGDVEAGWKIIEIQQEQVTVRDDTTGTTEKLALYENKSKTK